jgi:hypothetical protein
LKFCDFSKNSGDVPLWKIISRDPLGRFGREYACWKGQIVYLSILKKNYRLLPILGRGQYSLRYIFRETFDPTGSLWGLKPPTLQNNFENFGHFQGFKLIFNFLVSCKLLQFLLIQMV